jgi:hypothetical protein
MPSAALAALAALAAALAGASAGCSGGSEIGEACDRHSDCEDSLQCVRDVCVPRCERAPECGDGYSCDERGLCLLSHLQAGDSCSSEAECAPGLTCRIDADGSRLIKRCAPQEGTAAAGAACLGDSDCRNGTCALGHCVDLCRRNRDCALGTTCMQIPHLDVLGESFNGCFLSKGVVSWTIPSPPSYRQQILLPVPSGATHAAAVLSTAAPRRVGAVRVTSPTFGTVYKLCPDDLRIDCAADAERIQHYANRLRHRRELEVSVVAIPTTSVIKLDPGVYGINAASFHTDGTEGPPPAVTAVVRLGSPAILDLHFHFLDLGAHPCEGAFGAPRLDKTSAQTEASFQKDYLGNLRTILREDAELNLEGTVTYDDIARPDLDGLEIKTAGKLLELGTYDRGINVFFVRSLSPAGIQAFGPNPGPAGVGGTARSGIIISVDTLCYRSWNQLARLTAHEIARYMGLYQNVEVGGQLDPIDDSDASTNNLMFYSELGIGTVLSAGQREILHRSPVLR